MTEREADRFFGRSAEVAELVEDLQRNRLVAIVADSGAGKSSLAMAGLAPAFRGGALADPARRGPDDIIWHVVVMRPGGDPLEGLRRGVTQAGRRMGLSPDACDSLRRRLTLEDASHSAYALRCDLPDDATETLIIVDQFDELLTETPEAARAPFIDLLLKLVAMRSPGGFHVVLTVRVDYFNLCRPYGALYAELQKSEQVLRLKRISDAGLEEAVREPLRMAGFADEADQRALATEMRRDLGDRPGDLALAQMALWTVWRNRSAHGGSLIKAYIDVGGVSGALAQEAERIRTAKLTEAERALLPALFVRLVRLGETGGVLRRLADQGELDEARRSLASKLASDDYGRLLLVGDKIEVCHEALITQWPWLQNTLNAAAADLRVLERLMDRAATWRDAAESERGKHLATGAERELFVELRRRRDPWLSAAERDFIGESEGAFAREEMAKRRAVSRLHLLVAVLGAMALSLAVVVVYAVSQQRAARKQTHIAQMQAARAEAQGARADRDFGAAKQAIDRLTERLGIELEEAEGIPIATLRSVVDAIKEEIEALAKAEPGDKDLRRMRVNKFNANARIYLRAGDFADAEAAATEWLAMARDAQGGADSVDLLGALEGLAEIRMKKGDLAGARALWDEAITLAHKLASDKSERGLKLAAAFVLMRIGLVKQEIPDTAGARSSLEDALGIFQALQAQSPDGLAELIASLKAKLDGLRPQ
jgi:tetratricopeptide (TPR) repeat protein